MDYIYASNRPWAISAFLEYRSSLEGNWILVTNSEDLEAALSVTKPKYIFFPHWSEIVPAEMTRIYNCVCFHMTDVPFGRGGSPLQNLIKIGKKETKLSALKMEEVLDAGPVYKKDKLVLSGSAEQIFKRMSDLAIKQIQYIIEENPSPIAQSIAKQENFKRRTPADSEIDEVKTLEQLYDLIRMLDAPGYPKAFWEKSGFKFEFFGASIEDEEHILNARVKIHRIRN